MENTTSRHGFDEVAALLAARGVRHAVVEHSQTYTAASEARIAAVSADHAAKAVMTRDDAGYVLAVIPASEMLDLHKLRNVASRPGLRLATEREMATDFPGFEVGALPPFGDLFDCPEFIDNRLVTAGRILCNGGDHRHSIVLEARELRFAAGSGTGDLVADDASADRRVGRPSAR
jgi:Ala-tRNA(Pro) deacylase